MNKVIPVILGLFLFSNCGPEPTVFLPEPEVGMKIFPLNAGQVRVYAVDSIHYNSFNTQKQADTFHYWIKETVMENLDFDTLYSSFKVERQISADSGKTWQFGRNLVLSVSNKEAVRTDDGKRRLKLVFPLKKNASWNQNAYNSDEPMSSVCLSIDGRFDFQDTVVNNAVSISVKKNINLIRVDTEDEIYAPGLGMVKTEKKDIIYKDLEQTKADGYHVRYMLIDFRP